METEETNLYTYSSLRPGPNTIRLLRILPDAEGTDIRCELFDFQIRSFHSSLYEALSYCWGDATKKYKIGLNGKNHCVATNLFAALHRLRDSDLPRVVWIDAICINQNDLEERALQVQFMAKIYSSASRVVVWLGAEADESGEVCQMIRTAADLHQRGESRMTRNSQEDIKNSKETVASFNKFLGRAWFHRIWVIQEFAAAQSIIIYCGREYLGGHAFCQGLQSLAFLYEHDATMASLVATMTSLMQWDPVSSSSVSKGSSNPTEIVDTEDDAPLNIQTLGGLVEMFHPRGATDRRDKVYALLGMSTDSSALRVDYTAQWGDVFRRLISQILGPSVTVVTWPDQETAVIAADVCVLGRVTKIGFPDDRGGKQEIEVKSKHFRSPNIVTYSLFWDSTWLIQRTARPVKIGDLLCLVSGAARPTIVRPYKDYCVIIAITTSPPKDFEHAEWLKLKEVGLRSGSDEWTVFRRLIQGFHLKILMLWTWHSDVTFFESIEDTLEGNKLPIGSTFQLKEWQGFGSELSRLTNMARIFDVLEDKKGVGTILQYTYERRLLYESQYMEKLNIAHWHWDAYMMIKLSLEKLLWGIWSTNQDKFIHSYDYLCTFYHDVGNIKLDLYNMRALAQPIGGKSLQLDMLYKPHIHDVDPDPTRFPYDSVEKLLDELFPEYARLPRWNGLGTKYYWQSRFLRKLILHPKGDRLRVNDQIIASAAVDRRTGLLVIDLIAEYGNIYPSVDMVPHTYHNLLGPESYEIAEKLSYRFNLVLYILRHRDVVVLEYIVLKGLIQELMFRRRSPYSGIDYGDDVQINREGLLNVISTTKFCELCISQDGGALLRDLYVLHDVHESVVSTNSTDTTEHSKSRFEHLMTGEEFESSAEAARHYLLACLTERWGYTAVISGSHADSLVSDPDFPPLISVEIAFFDAVEKMNKLPYPVSD